MTDFTDYKTASQYAVQINAGYSARLGGKSRAEQPVYGSMKEAAAWQHGYGLAEQDEGRVAA